MTTRICVIFTLYLLSLCSMYSSSNYEGDWLLASEILKRIQEPVFPERDFDIREYGAKGDGATDCTSAIKEAIKACHLAGGGRVLVPKGNWISGPVHLKSNVNLHVQEGGTILFKTDAKAYLPAVLTKWEGVECYNYSP